VAGLAGVAHEALQEGQRLVPEVHPLHHQPAELEDVQPEAVAAAARVALHQPGGAQVDHEAVHGRLVQADALGDLGDAELGVVGGEGVEDRHRALDRLDAVPRTDAHRGDLAGVLLRLHCLDPVSHREHLSCDRCDERIGTPPHRAPTSEGPGSRTAVS
jgi:hypothetical protein